MKHKLVLFFILFVVFLNAETVINLDGHHWIKLLPSQKEGFIMGVLISHIVIKNVVVDSVISNKKEASLLKEWLSFDSISVGTIISQIDNYYENEENMDTAVWRVFYILIGKLDSNNEVDSVKLSL